MGQMEVWIVLLVFIVSPMISIIQRIVWDFLKNKRNGNPGNPGIEKKIDDMADDVKSIDKRLSTIEGEWKLFIEFYKGDRK